MSDSKPWSKAIHPHEISIDRPLTERCSWGDVICSVEMHYLLPISYS